MSQVFANCIIAVSGSMKSGWNQSAIEAEVTKLGGTFAKEVSNDTTHLLSSDIDVKKNPTKVKSAKEFNVSIVTLQWFLDSIDKQKKQPEADYALVSDSNGKATNGRQTRKRTAKKDAEAQDDEEEAQPPAKKAKAAPKGKAANSDKNGDDEKVNDKDEEKEDEKEEEKEKEAKMKTVVKKGKAPVDELCPLKNSHHVYVDPNGLVWDAALNQTNIGNNNNKFYYCQLLKQDAGNSYAVFCHWGRVGERGQSKMYASGVSLGSAEATFEKQFKSKTGTRWSDRENALGGGGKYAYLSRNYDDDSEDESAKAGGTGSTEDSKPVESKLAAPLRKLMELIFNTTFMQQSMKSLSYDSNKLPLGKLSKQTITRGYETLKTIDAVINQPSTAVANYSQYGNSYNAILNELTNMYYTVIPHDFGRDRPPVINTPQQLKKEISLVENLGDMVITTKIMKDAKAAGDVHILDKQFESLALNEAVPLDKSSDEYKHLTAYVRKTHGSTHHFKLRVEEIFRVTRSVEDERWQADGWHNLGNDNRKLLWHGSRTTNFAGILSQGLRIAPPEAPVNGYMFDKGIYLADIVSKSANYCCPYQSDNTGLLLLCEAQLGDPMFELTNADYHAATNCKKAGALATKGLGKVAPTKWEDGSVINENLKGIQIPAVSGKENDITGDSKVKGAYLQYNEYIVYNISQVKIRYLFRCRWD